MSQPTLLSSKRPRLDVALDAVANGYYVFPTNPENKRPLTMNGWKDASQDIEQVRVWWTQHPTAMPAIAVCDGVVMLDFDTKPAAGLVAEEVYERLGWLDLPETYEDRTSGGGFHLWYQYPDSDDMMLGIGAAVLGIPGFDIRSNGGYACIHFDSVPPPREQLELLPLKYHALLPRYNAGSAPQALGTLEDYADTVTTSAGQIELDKAEAELLQATRDGHGRHNAAIKWSKLLGGHIAGDTVSVADAIEMGTAFAEHWGGDDQLPTWMSGLRLGLREPIVIGSGDSLMAAARRAGLLQPAKPRTSKDAERDYNHACKHGTPDEQERFKAEAFALHEQEMQARTPQFTPPAEPPNVSGAFAARFHTEDELVLNDLENAKLLVDVHGLDIRHCERALGKGWLLWDGSRWVPDTTQHILHLATGIGDEWRRIATGASVRPRVTLTGQPKPSNQAALHLWASHCENHKETKAAVALASTRPEVTIQLDQLDLDPNVLATPGASYDLVTGEAYEPRREDYCTRLGGALEGDGTCPTWTAFLDRCMGGNQEMIGFLQRSVGYSMTGETGEQVWWQMYGKGANGKSTFVGAIMHVLGTYGSTVNISAFTERRHDPGIPNDIAALAGVRFVAVNEPNKTEALDTAKLKKITGGDDKLQARFLNKEFFEFLPQCKIWMLTNYQLVVKDDDDGFWRRVLLVPWTVQIPDAERDRHLGAKLRAESRGIFEWCLQGLREWRRIGLAVPASVVNATTKYREDMDILGAFMRDCCKVDPLQMANNTTLYAAYQTWAQENGVKGVWSHNALTRALKDRGFTQRPPSEGKRTWVGFSLLKNPMALPRTSFVQPPTTEVN